MAIQVTFDRIESSGYRHKSIRRSISLGEATVDLLANQLAFGGEVHDYDERNDGRTTLVVRTPILGMVDHAAYVGTHSDIHFMLQAVAMYQHVYDLSNPMKLAESTLAAQQLSPITVGLIDDAKQLFYGQRVSSCALWAVLDLQDMLQFATFEEREVLTGKVLACSQDDIHAMFTLAIDCNDAEGAIDALLTA